MLAVLATLLAGCSSTPSLLDDAGIEHITSQRSATGGSLLAPRWCRGLATTYEMNFDVDNDDFAFVVAARTAEIAGRSEDERMDDDVTRIGALLSRSRFNSSTDENAWRGDQDELWEKAQRELRICVASVGGVFAPEASVTELTGLPDGAQGWRFHEVNGTVTYIDYVLMRLDDGRVLAVSTSTAKEPSPLNIVDVMEAAVRNAKRIPIDD